MIESSSLKTIKYFAAAYPGRTAAMVAALVLAGVLEGVGLIALLPLITIVTGESGVTPPQVESIVLFLFSMIGLPVNLATLLIFLVLAITAKAVLSMLAMNQVAYAAPRVGSELRMGLLRSVLNARWTHFAELSSGAVANALGTEAMRAADVYRQACNILAYSVMIVVYTVLALAVSWQVTIAAVAASYIMAKILHPLVRWARQAGDAQTRLYSESLKNLAEVVTGIKPVKAMAREKSYSGILEGLTGNLQKAQRKQILNEEALRLLSEPLMVLFLAIGMFIALKYMSIAANELFFLAFLFSRLVARTMNAQRLYQAMVINESALWSLRGTIDNAEQVAETFSGTKQPSLQNSLMLQNVSFSYGVAPVLESVTLSFAARRLHAVLGPSGAGKTTLLDLIIGLHRPQSGAILVDGVPLDEIDIRAWRRMIGYVPQEVILFHGSIFYNVTMGDPSFTVVDAERALRDAGAWDFVQSLSEGIETLVGERGTKLSGGQRQRIAIARAIIHAPALLILDEATSALDGALEEALFRTVRGLAQSMTIIAISHKTSIRALADHVVDFNGQHTRPQMLAGAA